MRWKRSNAIKPASNCAGCNGVQLSLLDLIEEPVKQVDTLIRLLSRASRTLAQSSRPDADKLQWMPQLSAARDRASMLRSLIAKNPDQMLANLADSWRDRETSLADGSASVAKERPELSARDRQSTPQHHDEHTLSWVACLS